MSVQQSRCPDDWRDAARRALAAAHNGTIPWKLPPVSEQLLFLTHRLRNGAALLDTAAQHASITLLCMLLCARAIRRMKIPRGASHTYTLRESGCHAQAVMD